jgi:hypothetical protein
MYLKVGDADDRIRNSGHWRKFAIVAWALWLISHLRRRFNAKYP